MNLPTCGYRGCTEPHPWGDAGYYCPRHTEILRRQRAAQAERNRERARERNSRADRQRELYEAEMGYRGDKAR